eukprot:11486875-Prorocentrum_lima.AAC.1
MHAGPSRRSVARRGKVTRSVSGLWRTRTRLGTQTLSTYRAGRQRTRAHPSQAATSPRRGRSAHWQ